MGRHIWVSLGIAVACAGVPATGASQSLERPSSTIGATHDAQASAARASVTQQTQAQAGSAPTRRRKPSVVGYIDDATIESKVRLRFDVARGVTVPDRAEYFYAKCGCYRDLDPRDPAYDPNAPGPRPGAADNLDYRQLNVQAEVAIDSRLSIFGELPVRWLAPQSFAPGSGAGFAKQTGLGDVKGGIKLGLTDSASIHDVTARVQLYLPTGESARGLGTNHATVEPSLLLRGQLTPTLTLESQAGVWLPIGGAAPLPGTAAKHFAGRIFFYGIGPGLTIVSTAHVQVTPVVELVGWRVLAGNQTGATPDATDTNIVNLKFGVRMDADRSSFYIGLGRALSDATWYDDVLRLEYRYRF